MTDAENKALYIAEQCLRAGMTLAGVAGVIANVEAESAIRSDNLQDVYERQLGMSDAQYTAAVDSGTYRNFAGDSAGYGICQWTANPRKAKMLSYVRQRGKSIGDFQTQVDFMLEEMRDYSRAWTVCTSSDSAGDCGYAVCKYYEIPANTEAKAQNRAARAQNWYSFLAAQLEQGAESSITETGPQELDDDGVEVPRTWPPRTIDTRCEGWPEIRLLQAAMYCRGYNVLQDGIFGDALRSKVIAFQEEHHLDPDGVVGPMTWRELLKL